MAIPSSIKELREYELRIFKDLWELEQRNRYMEYEGFKRLTFKDFLWENFHVSYNHYRDVAWAWNWYPQYCVEYGSIVVIKVREKVGAAHVKEVFERIEKKVKKLKTPVARRFNTWKIIDEYRTKEKKKKGND